MTLTSKTRCRSVGRDARSKPAAAADDAGVVDQPVEPAEALVDLGEQPQHIGFVRHIGREARPRCRRRSRCRRTTASAACRLA